jgi:ADP-ribosylglycohydrolase
VPTGPWPWTDDTAMTLSVYQMLTEHGEVRQDQLARLFAIAYDADPYRNYGPSIHGVLRAIFDGGVVVHGDGPPVRWTGLVGQWAAMRVAPLGAWFADDLDRVVAQEAAEPLPSWTAQEPA